VDAPKPTGRRFLAAIVAIAGLAIALRSIASRDCDAPRHPPEQHEFVIAFETGHAIAEPPPNRVAVDEEVVPLAIPDRDLAGGVSAIDVADRGASPLDCDLVPARRVAICVKYDDSLAKDVEMTIDRVSSSIHDSARDGSTGMPRGESLRIPRREIGSVETLTARLAPGRYELSCRLDASTEISVVGDGTLQVEACSNQEIVIPLRVIRGTETLRGRIVEPSGAGVRGAQIRVEAVRNDGDRSLRVFRHVASTRDGSFEMKGLPNVPCRVDVIWSEGCMNPCRFGFTSTTVIAPSPREVLEIVVGELFDVDVFVQHPSVDSSMATRDDFDVLLEPLIRGETRRSVATRSPESRTTIVSFQRVQPGPHRVRVIERGTAALQRERTFEVESAAVGGGRGAIQVLVPLDP
jgi:hypothetical protein